MTNADVLSRSLRSLNRAASQLDHAVAEKLGLCELDYEAMGHIMDQDGAHLGPAELGHLLRLSTAEQAVIQHYLRGAGDRLRSHAATLSAAPRVGDLPHTG